MRITVPSGAAQPARALDLQEEEFDRIRGPGDLEPLAGKRAVLDRGAVPIGDEAAAFIVAAKRHPPVGKRRRIAGPGADQVGRQRIDRHVEPRLVGARPRRSRARNTRSRSSTRSPIRAVSKYVAKNRAASVAGRLRRGGAGRLASRRSRVSPLVSGRRRSLGQLSRNELSARAASASLIASDATAGPRVTPAETALALGTGGGSCAEPGAEVGARPMGCWTVRLRTVRWWTAARRRSLPRRNDLPARRRERDKRQRGEPARHPHEKISLRRWLRVPSRDRSTGRCGRTSRRRLPRSHR